MLTNEITLAISRHDTLKPLGKHMTLVISMLKNIFPLHTKMHDYHLTHPDVLL